MIRHIHHPSCPAGWVTPGTPVARCICPKPRRRSQLGEHVAFAAMLAAIVALPIYLLWKGTS